MRTLLVSRILVVFVLTFAGCNSVGKRVEVVIDGGGQFPSSLAGTWTSDKEGWELVFEPNGTISSAVVTFGRVRVVPAKITKEPMILGGEGIYHPGEWVVAYSPESRMLTVTIVLDRIHVRLGKSQLEGSSKDVFVGQVSEDGSEWIAEWTTFTHYTAHTAENPNADLSSDPLYGITTTLTFTKNNKPQ